MYVIAVKYTYQINPNLSEVAYASYEKYGEPDWNDLSKAKIFVDLKEAKGFWNLFKKELTKRISSWNCTIEHAMVQEIHMADIEELEEDDNAE